MCRAPEIARQKLRFAPIGPYRRSSWRNPDGHFENGEYPTSTATQNRARREFARSDEPLVSNFPYQISAEFENLVHGSSLNGGMKIYDYSSTVILHLALVENDLVVAVDASFEEFAYGRDAIQGERQVLGQHFADFGYDTENLNSENLLLGPIVRSGARPILESAINRLHLTFDGPILNDIQFATPSARQCMRSTKSLE